MWLGYSPYTQWNSSMTLQQVLWLPSSGTMCTMAAIFVPEEGSHNECQNADEVWIAVNSDWNRSDSLVAATTQKTAVSYDSSAMMIPLVWQWLNCRFITKPRENYYLGLLPSSFWCTVQREIFARDKVSPILPHVSSGENKSGESLARAW